MQYAKNMAASDELYRNEQEPELESEMHFIVEYVCYNIQRKPLFRFVQISISACLMVMENEKVVNPGPSQ